MKIWYISFKIYSLFISLSFYSDRLPVDADRDANLIGLFFANYMAQIGNDMICFAARICWVQVAGSNGTLVRLHYSLVAYLN